MDKDKDLHSKHNATTTSDFLKKLLETYDRRMRPHFDGPPTEVTVDIYFSRIDSVGERTMDFGATAYIRQQWNDPRLKYDAGSQHIPPSSDLIDKIWVPDLYFPNEKAAHFHDQTVDNIMLRFSPEGNILYSMRLSLTLVCQMRFDMFPMDSQLCGMQLETYGYTETDLLLLWRQKEPIQLPENLYLSQFTITDNQTVRCDKTYYTGTFSCIEATIKFNRALGYYWLSAFIPSILLVILSWVSFWINPQAAPARVSLGTTIVLTVTTQAIGVHASIPKVSYATAMDVWMLACLMFVVASLLQYAVVNFVLTHKVDNAKNDLKQMTPVTPIVGFKNDATYNEVNVSFLDYTRRRDMESQKRRCKTSGNHIAVTIDKFSRVMFPMAFILFNIVYWSCTKT
ncbi:glycine receptor subunit alpha-1-like [Saccoglossus kowalevskii]